MINPGVWPCVATARAGPVTFVLVTRLLLANSTCVLLSVSVPQNSFGYGGLNASAKADLDHRRVVKLGAVFAFRKT